MKMEKQISHSPSPFDLIKTRLRQLGFAFGLHSRCWSNGELRVNHDADHSGPLSILFGTDLGLRTLVGRAGNTWNPQYCKDLPSPKTVRWNNQRF